MALNRKLESERDALVRQAIDELRVTSPGLFKEPLPYTDEECARMLVDAAEIEQTWDEMERTRTATPKRYTAEELIDMDRGE